ncbi:unnamed protein product [Sphacelaria rigidula]
MSIDGSVVVVQDNGLPRLCDGDSLRHALGFLTAQELARFSMTSKAAREFALSHASSEMCRRFCLLHVGSRETPVFQTPPRRLAFNLELDGANASSALMGAENGHHPNSNMNNGDQQNRGYDLAVPGPPRSYHYHHPLGAPASGSGSGGFSVGVMGRGESGDGNGYGRRTRRVRASRIRVGGLVKCVGPNAR